MLLNIEFLKYTFLKNTVEDYLRAAFIFAIFLIIFKFVQNYLLRKLKKIAIKTDTDLDDTIIKIFENIKPSFYYFLSFYLSLHFLKVNTFFQKIIEAILVFWIIYIVIEGFQFLIDYLTDKKLLNEKDKSSEQTIRFLAKLLKASLWLIGLLLALSNLGFNITSLIAGLGIGGIAIALAVQNILSDLFSSFAIYFDKPFAVGDSIVIGNERGVVEKIGIKTTRIRSFQGEEIIISNKELTSATIHNFKKMTKRRALFSFGVDYKTPTEKLKKIPLIIKEIIEKIELAQFDRAHLQEFGEYALLFEVAYYVLTSDYKKYKDIHQQILLEIKEEFDKENIVITYPTQIIYLNK